MSDQPRTVADTIAELRNRAEQAESKLLDERAWVRHLQCEIDTHASENRLLLTEAARLKLELSTRPDGIDAVTAERDALREVALKSQDVIMSLQAMLASLAGQLRDAQIEARNREGVMGWFRKHAG